MKKSNLFIVLLTALIVMSCSKDETTMGIPQESNAIEFGTYVGRDAQTRASITNLSALQAENVGFGVFAHYTGATAYVTPATTPNFMYNQQVKYAGTKWGYTPVKYWPNNTGDLVSFFAYAPYEANPTTGATKGIKLPANTATGTPTIDFSINGSITNQVDLVYASAKDKNRELVDFQFKHALSRIGFSAKAADDYGNTKIKVKSVSIKGKFSDGNIYIQ